MAGKVHEEFSEKLLPHRSVHPSISTSLSFIAMASSVVTAATTLSLTEAEQILADQGFDVPHDLGGLRIEEIQEVLAPFGVLVPADLALLHRRGQTCLKKRDSRFLDPSNVLPPKLQRPDGASFAAPVSASVRAACSPSQPMQSARAPPSERGVQIASALVREVAVDKWSLLYSELSALPPSQQSQWQGSLAASLSNQFEFGTLSAALRSFRRLVHWLAEQTLPLECPDPSTLRAFLDLQRERGPTVPAAVLRQFLWFETQLRVPFHARSPLLADFLTQKAAPLPTQAEILTPAAWNHLLSLCSTSNSGWNGLQVNLVGKHFFWETLSGCHVCAHCAPVLGHGVRTYGHFAKIFGNFASGPISHLPPRMVHIFPAPSKPVVVYTDASTEAPCPSGCRIGVWIHDGETIWCESVDVPRNIFAYFCRMATPQNPNQFVGVIGSSFSCARQRFNFEV